LFGATLLSAKQQEQEETVMEPMSGVEPLTVAADLIIEA
jgi:hypothetical protein